MNKEEDILEQFEPLNEMASYGKKSTGITNTIFISPKGGAKHGARIKVAIDPPDSFNPSTKSVSIDINDYTVRGEAIIPNKLLKCVVKYIKRNYSTIKDYWEYKIDTAELTKKLIKVKC
ncbi:MAG: hypothetical protein HQK91_13920 [Nitrospirae bacterium]|nr:hypothetical protein [Nitrospirota bacterium]